MAVFSTLTISTAVLSLGDEASPDLSRLEGTGEALGKLRAESNEVCALEGKGDVHDGVCDEVGM